MIIALIIIYTALALGTLIPTLWAILFKVNLHGGGAGFRESLYFSDKAKTLLDQHWTRIIGTLLFWKRMATIYMRYHYYCISWTLISSWLVPLIAIHSGDCNQTRWLIVVVSSHVALALSFYRAFNVGENMKAFRLGESEFYDLYRRLLDRPQDFGKNEACQIEAYFRQVESVRRRVRRAEIWCLSSGDDMKDSMGFSGGAGTNGSGG